MSLHIIRVPDIGEGVAEVELVAWHVKPGDRIIEDQVLADVMTDKATVEVPSPVHGVVESLGGETGQVLAVGAELIRIETDAPVKPARGSAARAPAAAPAADRASAVAGAKQGAPASATTGARVAEKAAVQMAAAVPPAPSATTTQAPAAAATTDGAPRSATPARVLASPSVRARAWELGIDLAQVQAGSPSGRVMHADLDAHAARRGARLTLPPLAVPPRPSTPMPPRPAGEDTVEAIRIIGLRRKIAQKMQESTRRIPHFSYHEEVDVTELEALREHLNQRGGAGGAVRLSPLAFVIAAICRAVPEFPQVNGTLDDEAGVLHRHSAVHVGVAAQTDAGLLVPVLRDAHALGLAAIAAETARLAALARSGKATRDELSGSTITVTSLGKLGGIATTPVINHPEVAIVGVNKIAERPVMQRGAVVGRLMMNLSGSFDHRVVDGAVAAGFVQRVRELLEHPATLFLGDA
ncbi:MAG: 2-oxo acid dehydrogenase subunit E2 [Rubrivivax sp.]|nr:2-oxo acid dehydrogenase subunit E2 [Rubrivivax sp.]